MHKWIGVCIIFRQKTQSGATERENRNSVKLPKRTAIAVADLFAYRVIVEIARDL